MSDLIRWACRSPGRLVSLVALPVLLLVAAAAMLGGNRASPEPARTAAPTSAVAAPDGSAYAAAAQRFVETWGALQPGQTPEQWHAAVAALSTPELAAGLAVTDPDALPGAGAEGQPRLRYVADTSALVIVPLATGERVAVTVVKNQDALLIADIQPDTGDHGSGT